MNCSAELLELQEEIGIKNSRLKEQSQEISDVRSSGGRELYHYYYCAVKMSSC